LVLPLLFLRRPTGSTAARTWVTRWIEGHAAQLRQARVQANPTRYAAASLLIPLCLFGAGLLQSPVLGFVGGAMGFFAPRLYLRFLVFQHTRRSEAEAPRLLHTLLASLAAGTTYLEALRQARLAISDPWIRDDLDTAIQGFMLDVPLEQSLAQIRRSVRSRNLGLVWNLLAICCANNLPTVTARGLLSELASTVQFNVQLSGEVQARTSGQRLQVILLAIIVPGMYLYLRLLSPELLSALDETAVGRYVLVPLAAVLEVLGLYMSFRISQVAF
jgi:Flp pilus assembly protein TadB